MQRWHEALKDVETYLDMHPEDADLWYEKGRLNNILNKHQEALTALDRSIQLNNQQGLFYYEKMKSLLALGQKSAALALMGTVQKFGVQIEPEVQAALSQ